jgi:hypothetical protein
MEGLVSTAEDVADALVDAYGDEVQGVAWARYDEEQWGIPYIRDDVIAEYADEEVDRVYEQGAAEWFFETGTEEREKVGEKRFTSRIYERRITVTRWLAASSIYVALEPAMLDELPAVIRSIEDAVEA